MKSSRFCEEQIIGILKQAQAGSTAFSKISCSILTTDNSLYLGIKYNDK